MKPKTMFAVCTSSLPTLYRIEENNWFLRKMKIDLTTEV
jgi:hypothetical protein